MPARHLGAGREFQAEVRFVAATNVSLLEAVSSGTFRADLFYRLSVFTIELPALRARKEDILPLATHFLAKHCGDGAVPTLSAAAAATLLSSDWPGNVRELENAMIRAARLCECGIVDVDHLSMPGLHRSTAAPMLPIGSRQLRMLKCEVIRSFEHDYLSRVMQEADGNVTHAAKIAGKDRRDFGKLLKKHGLAGSSFRKSG